MPRILSLTTLVTLLCVNCQLTACSFADEKSDQKKVEETSKVDNPDVKLTAGTWKDVEAIVAKSAGKIVVVDIWSTSCLPCMQEFPHLVEIHKRHSDKVVCISFNVDYVGIK